MNLLAWIVLGLVAGAIAKMIYPGSQGGGLIGTLLLGVVGAFVGGTLFDLLQTGTLTFTASTLSFGGIVVAIIGALIAVFLYNMFTRRAA